MLKIRALVETLKRGYHDSSTPEMTRGIGVKSAMQDDGPNIHKLRPFLWSELLTSIPLSTIHSREQRKGLATLGGREQTPS